MGSKFSGVCFEKDVVRGKPDLLTQLVIGCGCMVVVGNLLVADSGSKQNPVGLPPDLAISPEVGLDVGYGDVILVSGEQ